MFFYMERRYIVSAVGICLVSIFVGGLGGFLLSVLIYHPPADPALNRTVSMVSAEYEICQKSNKALENSTSFLKAQLQTCGDQLIEAQLTKPAGVKNVPSNMYEQAVGGAAVLDSTPIENPVSVPSTVQTLPRVTIHSYATSAPTTTVPLYNDRVKALVLRLSGIWSLRAGARFCLNIGSVGQYTVLRTASSIDLVSGYQNCDLVLGLNGDYFTYLEAAQDPCQTIRSYYDSRPQIAWIESISNQKTVCNNGYKDLYNQCIPGGWLEKQAINVGCSIA